MSTTSEIWSLDLHEARGDRSIRQIRILKRFSAMVAVVEEEEAVAANLAS